MSKQVLGKGFDGLIPIGMNVSDIVSPGEQVKNIDIKKVVANPDQPRKSFDKKSLNELAESIKQHGIIQPLVVTPSSDGLYRIVAGERRFRASKLANLKTIPAIIRDHKELEELEIALVENVQRVDLSPLETAVSVVRLRDQFSLSASDIAKKLGKAETTVSNIIRLLQLPQEAIEALQKNQITEGHARAILALKTDEKLQKQLLNKIVTQKISVRDAEEFVKQNRSQKNTKLKLNIKTQKSIKDIEKSLATKINVKQKGSGGMLTLGYKSEEQLDHILKLLDV